MLTDLLRALASDRPLTMADLAGELGTDTAGLRRAMDHCERLGYLERTGSGLSLECSATCGKGCGCSVVSACDTATGASWWQVTERGRRAARLGVAQAPASAAGGAC